MAIDGAFVWYDLMTTDLDAALAFYGKVLGWTSRDSGMPGDQRYMLIEAGGVQIAGALQISQEMCDAGQARTGWMAHIHTADVDAKAQAFRAAGGAVHNGPSDIPGVGRYAVVSDPQGAVVSLYKSLDANPAREPAPMGVPGHPAWRELHAGDGESAMAFYAAQFGWVEDEAHDMGGPVGIYRTFSRAAGEPAMGGMMTKMPDMPAPAWIYYFAVDSAGAAAERVRANGGQVLMEPHPVPGGGWIAPLMDPQGGMFSVLADKA